MGPVLPYNPAMSRYAIVAAFLFLAAIFSWAPTALAMPPDGAHDFDFAFGTFHTHVRRLPDGSAKWITTDGIVTTRKIWNGKANLEELEIPMPSDYLEGITLRLYDPTAREWNLYFADSRTGEVESPEVGRFANGRGVFYSYEMIGSAPTYVRQTYFDATPTSYKFEQAFSWDAGKTWHPNFVASLNRIDPATVKVPQPPATPLSAQQHGFDWQFGLWNIHMHALLHALTPSSQWEDLKGTVNVMKLWSGRANLAEIEVSGPTRHLEILALRLFQPQTRHWTLAFAGSGGGALGAPMYGSFKNGRGVFYDQESYNGRTVLDRFVFFDTAPNSARDVEALSEDGGKSWTTIFDNRHTRTRSVPAIKYVPH